MPGFDGTGPSGRGPMSGQGRGFCVLRSSEKSPHQLQGFAGLRGVPVDRKVKNFENIGNMFFFTLKPDNFSEYRE